MKPLCSLFALVFTFFIFASLASSKRIVGYYESWSQYRKVGGKFVPADIDPSIFTHLNYAFVDFGFISPSFPDKGGPKLTGDYKITEHEWNDVQRIKEFQTLKAKNTGLKTLISIGGWNFNDKTSINSGKWTHKLFSEMAASAAARAEFIDSAIKYAKKHGFDGVDIDWEFPGDSRQGGRPVDFANFLTLLKEFRAKTNMLLTVATAAIVTEGIPKSSVYYGRENYYKWLAECAKHVDWMNIMAYDYHGAWEDITGVLAPLLEDSTFNGQYSVRDTLDGYLKLGNVPPGKLNLGIALYGRGWTISKIDKLTDSSDGYGKNASGLSPAGPSTGEKGYMSYFEIASDIKSGGLSSKWDDCTSTPYAFNTAKRVWFSYENKFSAALKASYAMQRGLGGVMVWATGLDQFSAEFPLIRAIRDSVVSPSNRVTPTWKGCHGPQIPEGTEYSTISQGSSASIAVNGNGVVVQTFIERAKKALYLRIGTHAEDGVHWGKREKLTDGAEEASVALNDDNYIVIVYTKGDGNESDNYKLYCRLGRIQIDLVTWSSEPNEYSSGVDPAVAINNENVVVAIHGAGTKATSRYRYYGTGRIQSSRISFGNFLRFKENGGRKDELGMMGGLDINSKGDMIEVHKSQRTNKLWYRIGRLSGLDVTWGDKSHQYDTGQNPDVALLNDGLVVEVHQTENDNKLWYNIGTLDGTHVSWITGNTVDNDPQTTVSHKFDVGRQTSVGMSGTRDDFTLVESHLDESDEYRILAKSSIPLVDSLLPQRPTLYERVGLALGSHGVNLESADGDWMIVEIDIAKTKLEKFWSDFKLALTWIPIVPDLIGIIENSIKCDGGNKDACTDIVLDAASLSLSIVPGGAAVKGPAKSVIGIFRGVDGVRDAGKFKIDDILDVLDKRDMGLMSDWFRRNPEFMDRMRRIEYNRQCKPRGSSRGNTAVRLLVRDSFLTGATVRVTQKRKDVCTSPPPSNKKPKIDGSPTPSPAPTPSFTFVRDKSAQGKWTADTRLNDGSEPGSLTTYPGWKDIEDELVAAGTKPVDNGVVHRARCHLIGKQLGGKGIRDNLFACHQYFNTPAMVFIENKFRDVLKSMKSRRLKQCTMDVILNYISPKKYPASVSMIGECDRKRIFDVTITNTLDRTQVSIVHLCKPEWNDLGPDAFAGSAKDTSGGVPC